MTLVLGINASRARSGGAVAHLKGILNSDVIQRCGFDAVHIWCPLDLAAVLPCDERIMVHSPHGVKQGLLLCLFWEKFQLPKALRKKGCSILLNVDAGSICRFQPSVSISQDMLSFEPDEMGRFPLSLSWLRLLILRYVQSTTLRTSRGVIFLTNYAAETAQRFSGKLSDFVLVPHGVDSVFFKSRRPEKGAVQTPKTFRFIYVSNALPYKHQWKVIEAISLLRIDGIDARLELVGGGQGPACARMKQAVKNFDPHNEFVTLHEFLPQQDLPKHYESADIFIFASSCENMPITLIEAMAAGLPIACSDYGPMPEVLQDAGVYFDPLEAMSIARALKKLISSQKLRASLAGKAVKLASQYSWQRCSEETLGYLIKVARKPGNR